MRTLVAAAAVAALVVVPVSEGADSATRIVDRTLVCRTSGEGHPDPARFMDVAASPVDVRWRTSPTLSVSNGFGDTGVSVGARTGRGSGSATGEAWLTPRRCTVTSRRVPLASTGLRGGSTGPFSKSFACEVPARVVIRLRAVFTRPTTVVPDRRFPCAHSQEEESRPRTSR